MSFFYGLLGLFFFAINTLFACSIFYPILFFQKILPFKIVQIKTQKALVIIAEMWIAANSLYMRNMLPLNIFSSIPLDLSRQRSYLVISNHRSWVDILILQFLFNRRAPFFRFFIKDSLKWVPLLGGAWKALGFPFMKRKDASSDLKEASTMCNQLSGIPAVLLIFLEGTRFTLEKSLATSSKYKNLLKPKTLGASIVLDSLGNQINYIIDVSIVYSKNQQISFFDFLSGKVKGIWVEAREIQIPARFRSGCLLSEPKLKEEFDLWIAEIWSQKDRLIDQINLNLVEHTS